MTNKQLIKSFKTFIKPYTQEYNQEFLKRLHKQPYSNRQSLILSLAKWYLIVFEIGIDFGFMNCNLCKKSLLNNCQDCIIQKLIGRPFCNRTPYFNWINYHKNNFNDPNFQEKYYHLGIVVYNDESRKLAVNELIFLGYLCRFAKIDLLKNVRKNKIFSMYKNMENNLKSIEIFKQIIL